MVGSPGKTYGKVYVLRIGHRRERDKRVTTHVALVSRALGANGFILAGDCDKRVLASITGVVSRWGGDFYAGCTPSGVKYVEEWREEGGEVVHLTMYGLPLIEVAPIIAASSKPKLVVVGAEKVPREYYELADYNVSVTSQPHSEVAALAVFLTLLFDDSIYYTVFRGKTTIYPSLRGKRLVLGHGLG